MGWFVYSSWSAGVAQVIRDASPLLAAAAALAALANLALKAWRWRQMLKWALGLSMPWGKAMAMVPVGVAAGAIVPGRMVDLGKPALLATGEGVRFGQAVGLTLWERLHDLAALMLLAGIAGFVWSDGLPDAGQALLRWLAGAVAVAGAVGTAVLVLLPGPLERWSRRLLGSLPAPSARRRAAVAGLSILALGLEALRAELSAAALGWSGGVGDASAAFLLGSITGIASMVPGGMGISEWSSGLLLSRAVGSFGGVAPKAAGVVVLDRLLAYYLPCIAGGVLMAAWSTLFRRRDRVEGSSALATPPEAATVVSDSGKAAGVVWVVLPAYNEASNIGPLIDRIAAALASRSYEVVVVDDGSVDGTAEAAREAAARHGCALTILRHPTNQGLAPTLRDGLRWAAERAHPGDVILCLDADDTQDPTQAPAMLEQLAQGFDVVVASRYRRGAREIGVPWLRRLMSRVVNGMLQIAVPVRGVRDYTSGYRAYRASLLQEAFAQYGDSLVDGRTFACTAQLLLHLGNLGAHVSEIPLVLRYDRKRGMSKIRVIPTVLEYFGLIARQALKHPATLRRLLWMAALLLFVVPLTAPLTDGDSHYYAEIAQEMLRSHDWVTPRHPAAPDAIVDKPPLTLWMLALSFRLLGVNELAARLWQVLMGFGLLWLTMDIGRLYLPERAAVRAGWVLLTSALFWYAVLVPQQDVATAFFATLAFWAVLQFEARRHVAFVYLAWAALAGQMLSRGPFGVALTGVIIVVYALVERKSLARLVGSRASAVVHMLAGALLFAVLGLSWFVVESYRLGPAFVEVFFTGGTARFFSGAPAAQGVALVFGYLPLLAAAVLPWSGWLPGALARAVREARQGRLSGGPAGATRTFVIVWAVAGFLALHAISWRVIRYLLPILPATALLVAEALEKQEPTSTGSVPRPMAWSRWERTGHILTLVLLAPLAFGGLALPWLSLPSEADRLRPLAQAFLSVFTVGVVIYWGLVRRGIAATVRGLVVTAIAAYLALSVALMQHGETAFPKRLGAGDVATSEARLDSRLGPV